MVTITDVAARAGVGSATVSRVLNDSPRVSAATRARVLGAIEALDYHPNPLAQRFSRGRTQTLGVIVPFFTNASTIERLRGVVAALNGSPYDLVLFNVESSTRRDELLASLTRPGRADALLVMSMRPPTRAFASSAGPIVLIAVRDANVATVVTDDVEGGRMATTHLVALGHERIAFIGDESEHTLGLTHSSDREQGYREVLDAAGIKMRPTYVRYGPLDRRAARRITEHFLAQRTPPTAIFASSDVHAVGVLEAARTAGLSVPDELSVVGFDDIEISAYTGLTTVHQPLFETGELGARLVLDALASGERPAPRVHELPLDLHERSTTAPPRSRTRG